jgi:hypothetical protein
MKICLKDNCYKESIPRGKYCTEHCTVKKKLEKLVKEINKDKIEKDEIKEKITKEEKNYNQNEIKKINDLFEERKLKSEQDEEYQMSLIADRERINKQNEENELKEILELSKKSFIEEKRSKILEEPECDYYTIQFKLPSGTNIKRKFSRNCKFSHLRNYLDIYFYDNNLDIINYDLIIFPKITFTIENNNDNIENYNFPKNLTFFIYNLDS